MLAPALLVIDGNNYMSTKTAAELWGIHPKTVSNYCKDNRIKNKFKNGRLGWYIRTDEIKPLSQEEIRRMLILTLQLKNNPDCEIDWMQFQYNELVLDSIYTHLHTHGYIQGFSIEEKKRIPYDVVLTQKGMELATTFRKGKISNFTETLRQWLPIVISAAQLYFQINPTI